METPVLCFSRDGIIDLSPPEEGRSVPLSWIQFYAHLTDHHVWACGNQQLQIEAGIPTPYEAKEILERNGIQTNLSSAGGHKHKMERLQIIDMLYRKSYEDTSFVVIDSERMSSLSERTNWTVLNADEFVHSVEAEILDIPSPEPEMVSGTAYYNTNKHGTYRDMLSDVEKHLKDSLRN